MGTVYLGRMTAGSKVETVAIKVLHPHLAGDEEMVAMFLDEARVATRLRHPNLVGVLDMDLLRDELVIVMEYVEGSTLQAMQGALRQRGQKLPIGISARILNDALRGLQAMHDLVDENGKQLGLVHRDVSPHNLLVGTDGVTRVTDFGITLATGRLSSTRPDGTVKGKLQYLAPEQVGRKTLDRRVDVFAAGIVFWECLTGERLFDGATEAETVTRVLRDPISPPSMSRPDVSTDLDEVCLRALERDPDRRFRTADEFADALRHASGPLADASEVGALVWDLASEVICKQRSSLQRASSSLRPSLRGNRPLLVAVALACAVGGAAVARLASSSRRPLALGAHRLTLSASDTPQAVTVDTSPPPTPPAASAAPSVQTSAGAKSADPPRLPRPKQIDGDAGIAAPLRRAPKPPRPFMPNDL
jgi:serine/threonine-protein kinase